MPIMATILYRDMLNFFRNKFADIILLALLTALISVLLGCYALAPAPVSEQILSLGNKADIEMLSEISFKQIIEHMSIDQQIILLKTSAAGTLAGLVGNALLTGGLLTMIRFISNKRSISVLGAIVLSVRLLPRLLLLIFITTLLVQLGLLLVVVPGFLLSIAFSLSPVIATIDNLGVIRSMRASIEIAFANIRLISPAVLLSMFAKTMVLLLVTPFIICHPIFTAILLNLFSNLISSLLLIYLYRLYMLLRVV
ncbi:YciC family protein [Candidatus Palibaumannia cicadellinicola]|uniref:UPF0259 membrane protein YciC n=1 Tax=Candidatus Palibaumannia cicadellinicola TaxID=186490 RepID=A0A088MY54_9GAMM|nr:YciC family protein [Candidatus Baumannia cicadellinicola]AIN47222.1 Membrane protein YciC, linked to IspA [Candidatus Baumannia cicadellinicola]